MDAKVKDIQRLADSFSGNKPPQLTVEELNDVIKALRVFAEHGKETSYPTLHTLA
ncbi:hypothetical protein KZO25_13700 [Halomonas sp. ANAO-440]|uniref:hypothetical protein n=1 Tax=Halomonas sp. ANAO-440 TaxID=2861360 RepID=UPI001CAA46FB|nr:hypothetical protein [Halomonas sp. ANAO-440]MBZ0331369.1 hypothetical protein [Halomonas sp. ANAO-440]